MVTGADTLSLLFDTGGGSTLLTPEVARRLGCHPRGEDVAHRMTGERVVFGRCQSLVMAVGSWSARVAPVGMFDLASLLPRELPPLDGVLALDAFSGRVITVDWAGGWITVHGDASATDAVARWGVPLRFGTGESGRFLGAFARVDGHDGPLWFLIDSGNLRGTLVAASVRRDSLLTLADSGRAVLRIGARPPIVTGVAFESLSIDGALGTDFLLRGPVTFDLRRTP